MGSDSERLFSFEYSLLLINKKSISYPITSLVDGIIDRLLDY